MRKLVSLVMIILLAGTGGWYLGKHDSIKGLDGFDLSWLLRPQPAGFDNQTVPVRTTDTIRIATFNIQVFGRSKMDKPHVVDLLARIVRQFDVVAIQEIRSRDESVLPQFVDIVNQTGRRYDYAIGPRLGRSNSKEQYAFVFDTSSIELDRSQLYTVDDPQDLLHREPYVGWFRVRGIPSEKAFTFTLANIHTDPDETDTELNVLDDVYRVVRDDGRNEDDVIILGDLNVDDRHLGELGHIPGITWVVSGVPTNTRGTAQYDNILFHSRATREFTGRGGVFDFLREYNLTMEEALEVSDHFPVWIELNVHEGGTPGHVAAQDQNQVQH